MNYKRVSPSSLAKVNLLIPSGKTLGTASEDGFYIHNIYYMNN